MRPRVSCPGQCAQRRNSAQTNHVLISRLQSQVNIHTCCKFSVLALCEDARSQLCAAAATTDTSHEACHSLRLPNGLMRKLCKQKIDKPKTTNLSKCIDKIP